MFSCAFCPLFNFSLHFKIFHPFLSHYITSILPLLFQFFFFFSSSITCSPATVPSHQQHYHWSFTLSRGGTMVSCYHSTASESWNRGGQTEGKEYNWSACSMPREAQAVTILAPKSSSGGIGPVILCITKL